MHHTDRKGQRIGLVSVTALGHLWMSDEVLEVELRLYLAMMAEEGMVRPVVVLEVV